MKWNVWSVHNAVYLLYLHIYFFIIILLAFSLQHNFPPLHTLTSYDHFFPSTNCEWQKVTRLKPVKLQTQKLKVRYPFMSKQFIYVTGYMLLTLVWYCSSPLPPPPPPAPWPNSKQTITTTKKALKNHTVTLQHSDTLAHIVHNSVHQPHT